MRAQTPMVKQKRFSAMSAEAQAQARESVRKFSRRVCSVNSQSGAGILKLRAADGKRRTLYTHQVIAAQRLLHRQPTVQWSERKSSMLAIHEVGSGKTITAILTLVGVYKMNPDPVKYKTLIVVPKTMLSSWYQHLKEWTTLGIRVFKLKEQGELKRVPASFEERYTMKQFCEHASEKGFIRVHRSYAVQSTLIDNIRFEDSGDGILTLLDSTEVPVSRRYKDTLKARLSPASPCVVN